MNLDPKFLAQVMAAMQASGTAGPFKDQAVDQAATQATQEVTKSPKKADGFLSGLLNVAKKVAPAALSFIPGGAAFAPAVSQVLSTLNDDEWFSQFQGNGASFNQFLNDAIDIVDKEGYGAFPVIQPRGALAQFLTSWNQSSAFMDTFMPQVIADIRRVTNNVLVDNTALYYAAFTSAVKILSLYYTLEKYRNLSALQPLNIPLLTAGIPLISPVNISPLTGIITSLKDYISTTIRLPYALTEYLRWRYGTVFHSSNTGKPALIMYDAISLSGDEYDPASIIEEIVSTISSYQTAYTAAGRAGADMKLTFDSHEQRLTVEMPHYDEKEFNLRTNMDVGPSSGLRYSFQPFFRKDGKEVIMDSRLDMNAAIQAILISTTPWNAAADASSSSMTPFIVNFGVLSWYSNSRVAYKPDGTRELVICTVGWNRLSYYDGTVGLKPLITDCFKKNQTFHLVKHPVQTSKWALTTKAIAAAPDSTAIEEESVRAYIYLPSLLASLQLHNRQLSLTPLYTNGEPLAVDGDDSYGYTLLPLDTILSYDTAYLNRESIENIQRSAIRNLVRADYKRKNVAEMKTEIKEGLVEAVTPATKV